MHEISDGCCSACAVWRSARAATTAKRARERVRVATLCAQAASGNVGRYSRCAKAQSTIAVKSREAYATHRGVFSQAATAGGVDAAKRSGAQRRARLRRQRSTQQR